MLMVACAVCVHFVIWQSHCSCPSVMLTEDINSLLPEADNPSFKRQGSAFIYTAHLSVQVCKTPQCECTTCAAHCVCLHCPGSCVDVRNGEGEADR